MPPEDNDLPNDTAVLDDRRAAIEAAFETHEETSDDASSVVHQPPAEDTAKVGATPPSDDGQQGQGSKVEKPIVEVDPTDTPAPTVSVDKPPQSWRAPQKAKWATLDPEVRQEVIRREREITRTLGETSQARQFATQFAQTIQPYQAHLQSMGAAPIQAVERLLQADYLLSTAPRDKRAQLMAKLIADYDVDVNALDSALAGKPVGDPMESKVEQMLAQRLAPLQQFLAQQEQARRAREEAEAAQVSTTIEEMASDATKYPYFDAVREDMADLVDLSAKRGIYITLPQAYTRAIAMNPEVSQQVAAQREAEAKKAAAQTANARAQRALKASVSVGGSPSGVPSGTSVASDRRATIAAAFDSVEGR